MIIKIKVPALAESVADATLLDWQKQVGDFVKRGDHLIDLETDKVTLEINANEDGLLKEVLKNSGDIVLSGELLATLETDAEDISSETTAKTHIEVLDEATVSESISSELITDNKKSPTSGPAVRKMILENDLDRREIKTAKGTKRIRKEDVLSHLNQQTQNNKVTQADNTGEQSQTSRRQEHRKPMSRLRQRAAERLLEAQQNNAILTTFNEVNLHAVKQLREKLQASFEKKYACRLGFMPFFVKATINALREFPLINASIDDQQIVYHDYFDIGIAVSSPRGLVVPVLRDVDQLGFAEIETRIRELGERARNSTLAIEDLSGGTFTITNGGTFGSMLSTPIINPPQSAILGMHAIQDRPIAEDKQVVIRPVMYIALSYDHRIIDGREAVSFLFSIKKQLEDPALLFIGEL